LTFDLLSAPDSPLDGPFLMRFSIPENSDLTPLADATNAFTQCSGRGSGDVTIAGPLDHPYWYGTIKVRDAGFVLKRMSEIYQDVEVDGRFAQDVLTLPHIQGREGAKGTFHGSGTVTFSGLELETFAIDLVTDRFLIASIPDLRVLVRSEDVRLSGVKVGPDSLIVPRFTGNLEVIKARYTGDFSENTAGLGDPLAATVAPDWLADVAVVAPPRTVRIFNRAMELYMSGDVNLVRDVPGLYLRGSMAINAGRFPVFNNDFKVVRGRLDFSREVGLIPRVDMEAETRVRVQSATDPSSRLELISVYVTGSLAEPEVSFSSESGYAREGIERLLLGLSPYADQPQAYSGLRGASIAAGFNLLEREIAIGLNVIDTFDIEQVDRQTDGGATVSPLIGVGKYLGQDLYVKYAQGLSQADRDLLIEYQITHHLLLQSSMRRRIDELQGDTTYNLDLKYRFEY
jgi:autotransporter translocation and assembly factor TamB